MAAHAFCIPYCSKLLPEKKKKSAFPVIDLKNQIKSVRVPVIVNLILGKCLSASFSAQIAVNNAVRAYMWIVKHVRN
jgi:hypothetical protein